MRLLLAEDEPTLAEFIERGLREAGHAVDTFHNGEDALTATLSVAYDLAILDVNLPGMSGFEICRRIRSTPERGPAILFLTARDAIEDRVMGLDIGGEDYLVKPFSFPELLARVRALLRRGAGTQPILQIGELSLDPSRKTVTHHGRAIPLTAKEFSLLEYLMRCAGMVVTKPMIAEHVWNFELAGESNFIEVYIYSIRKKLGSTTANPLIQTVRGVGYRIDTN